MSRPPTLDEQRAFYDRWNLTHRSGAFGDREAEVAERGRRLFELAQAQCPSPAAILEVGCGTGWLTERLVELGPVIAIDLSAQAIEEARKRPIAARFIAGDFLENGLELASFDLVVCLETLFYVYDQPRFVAELARVLKPGGCLCLGTLNKFVYERRRDIGPLEPGQIRHWLSRREVERLLRPWFEVSHFESLRPAGDRGILRAVNSVRVNGVLAAVFSAQRVRRVKERLGLGAGNLFVAKRRARV